MKSIYSVLFMAFAVLFSACDEYYEAEDLVRTLNSGGATRYHSLLTGQFYLPNSFKDNPVIGFCLSSEHSRPTIEDEKIILNSTDLWMRDKWLELRKVVSFIPNRTYYYRAFIEADGEVYYGELQSFDPPAANFSQGTFLDERTGLTYRTVSIEGQTLINDDVTINGSSLYEWFEAQELAPTGWHVPSKDEFEQLINSVGPAGSELSALAHPELVNIPVSEGRFIASMPYWTSTQSDDGQYLALYYMYSRLYIYEPGPDAPPTFKCHVRYFKD